MSFPFDLEARGEGPPVLFLHGLTFDRRLLLEASEPIFDQVRARRIYVDLPGHGATPGDARVASAEGLVEALAQLLDEACGGKAPIVVGHSYGAYLGLGLAAARRLQGLVLVTPVIEPDLARRTVPARRVSQRDAQLSFLPQAPERATFEDVAVVQTAAMLTAYQRLIHAASERTDRAYLEAVRGRYVLPTSVISQIAAAPQPTLVLCGRDDHWVGYEDAIPLVRALPRAELTVLPDCGHLLPLEAADRYRAIVGGFLARTVGI